MFKNIRLLTIKKIFFFVFVIQLSIHGTSQNTYVPDDNFEQALIDLGYDTGPLDDYVPTTNINGILDLDVSLKNITDLTGIQDFTSLTILDCSQNQLSVINLSQNTNLLQLFIYNNQITNLNVTILNNLQILWCNDNLLNNLDVSQNLSLISLVCDNNSLTSLDVSQNTILNVLSCQNNQIAALNITNNLTLNRLECAFNQLSVLNTSQNTSLTILNCQSNNISTLDFSLNTSLSNLNCSYNLLSELDLSVNSLLTEVLCNNNNLCNLNVRNGNNNNMTLLDFSSNINLNCVVVDNPNNTHQSWQPTNFSNYVASLNNCNTFINIDTLDSVITNSSYTLPTLTFGNYFTQSGGQGTMLFTGDIITSSQTIYIYNETICGSNESSFNILITNKDYFIPKYFTPNNDGFHDKWIIQDFSSSIRNINIFNRHGKLLKTLSTSSDGWNGTFNGKLLKSDDYWYVITLNSGEKINGHFTLKR